MGTVFSQLKIGWADMQVPTTVMATVDSSVGGKTGVNHPLGKNMKGAFNQPQCVLIDTDTLITLPDRELASGVSEIIKYGLIRDAPLFEWLEQNMDKLLQREPEVAHQQRAPRILHEMQVWTAARPLAARFLAHVSNTEQRSTLTHCIMCCMLWYIGLDVVIVTIPSARCLAHLERHGAGVDLCHRAVLPEQSSSGSGR